MSLDLGNLLELVHLSALAWMATQLRTVLRRSDKILRRLGVVEDAAGVVPPREDQSGPRPITERLQ